MKAPDLGKMAGPLPLGAWLLVVGGGLYLASRAHKTATAAPKTTAAATPADTVGMSSGAGGGFTGATTTLSGLPVANPAGATSGATPAPLTSNSDWLRAATDGLVGRGYLGYTTSQALESYLEGNQLTADQARLVESAIKTFGVPPNPPSLAPAPIPDPGSASPAPLVAAPPPAPAPPPPPPPSDTAIPNLPADLQARIAAGGERIVGALHDPLTPGGGWYFGSLGGVFQAGTDHFYGAARGYGFSPGFRELAAYEPLGNGYRIISTRGEHYDFAG